MSGNDHRAGVPPTTTVSKAAESHPAAGKIDFDDFSANYDALLHESTKLYAEDSEYFARYKV
ncbi:MAG: hypothetical protein EOO23_08430, partial [Comamonadaceae bacterium]